MCDLFVVKVIFVVMMFLVVFFVFWFVYVVVGVMFLGVEVMVVLRILMFVL